MNGSALNIMLGTMFGLTLATVLPEELIEILGFIALTTGLFVAAARAGADVLRADEDRTRALTALGFFYGFATSIVVLVIAAIFDLLD